MPRRHPVASQAEHGIPCGLHQGIEYILAIALGITAIHISGRPELVMLAGAVLLAALAAFTKGPLAGFRVLAPRPHRVLQVVLAVLFVASPAASLRHPSAVAIGLLELCGLVLARLAYVGIRPPRPAKVPAPVATRVSPESGLTGSARATSVLGAGARSAGRASAQAKRKVGEAAPVADELLGRGARRLGAAVGRRSAKRAERAGD